MRRIKIGDSLLIVLAFVVGIPLGIFFGEELAFMEYLGTIFINLLKMIIVPLVTFSLILSVARFEDSNELKRLGGKTALYYMMTSFLAIITGLTLFNLIGPGEGIDVESLPVDLTQAGAELTPPQSIWDVLVSIVPENPIQALAEMRMLNVIFFSLIFGIALSKIEPKYRDHFLNYSEAIYQTMIVITSWIIKLAPIGILGLLIKAINDTDVGFMQSVLYYILTVAAGLLIHLFIVQPLVLFLFTKENPYSHFRRMSDAILTVLATASSLATIPVTMRCVEEKAGVSPKISRFIIPLGATVNMDGSALFECAGALFVAQILGVDLNLTQQIVVVMTALLASIGAAGIPSGGIVVIFIVTDAVGLSGSTTDFIIGIMLAVDRPLDLIRGVVNIFGDSIGAVVVDRSEGRMR